MTKEENQTPFRILIASDSRLEKLIISDGLERAFSGGIQPSITACSSGDEALDLILNDRPDMVFLDWVMPGMEGPEVCRRFRKKLQGTYDRYCYIFITTSKGDRNSIVHGLSSGADDFITKPFDAEEINARISVGMRLVEAYREVCRQKEAIDFLSRVDPLTGNLNRRHILSRLDKALEEAQNSNSPLSLCICDIDYFKSINDSYGHQAGDFVLKKIGYIFEQALGDSGVVGRYGGDEFLFLFSSSGFLSSWAMIQSLYDRIKRERFVFNGTLLKVSLSCGLTSVEDPMGKGMWSSGMLVKVADDALYEAKRRGRGRACFCDGAMWMKKGDCCKTGLFQDLA